MKVLFICPYNPFPPNSGNKTLTYNLIKSLSNDIKIDILIIEGYSINKFFNCIDNIGKIKKHKINKIKKNNSKIIVVAIPLLTLFSSRKSTIGSRRYATNKPIKKGISTSTK